MQDYVINLPRSAIDHVTNQIDFGPDGALYFLQGSISAMGAPDNAWGLRAEVLLSAAVLRFDPALWNAAANGPLDVHTEDADPYDPFAAGAPLTIYATGVRNAYDLVWHSNGNLYVPTNGSAAGGNTPGHADPIPPGGLLPRIDAAINGPYTGPDRAGPQRRQHAARLAVPHRAEGGYYGHPNPTRNEFVLNGGNPTSGTDPAQVSEYPVGTLPDRNWRGFAFDFGLNRSADGVIEYKYGGFGGALVGKLLVVRFSSGDDIIVLEPGLDGNIISSNDAIASFDGFDDPLDLVENPVNGFLYVSQFDRSGGNGTITLLRPQEPNIVVNKDQLIFDEVRGGAASAAKTITVSNTGNAHAVRSSAFRSPAPTRPCSASRRPSRRRRTSRPAVRSTSTSCSTRPPATRWARRWPICISRPTTPTARRSTSTSAASPPPARKATTSRRWQWILDTFRIPIDVGDRNDDHRARSKASCCPMPTTFRGS